MQSVKPYYIKLLGEANWKNVVNATPKEWIKTTLAILLLLGFGFLLWKGIMQMKKYREM